MLTNMEVSIKIFVYNKSCYYTKKTYLEPDKGFPGNLSTPVFLICVY